MMKMTQKLSSSASITVIASDLSDGIVKELRAHRILSTKIGSHSPLRVVMMRYRVSFYNEHTREEVIEASELREASEIVKVKFPNHLGYSIKQDN